MSQDAPWDEIARAYRDLATPIAEIAERFGLGRQDLINAARERDWPTRADLRVQARAQHSAVSGGASTAEMAKGRVQTGTRAARNEAVDKAGGAGPPAKAGRAARSANPLALVKRIYNTIDKELSKLEEHAGASSQDRERASRALSQTVSSLEKAVEMQREITREQGRKGPGGKDKEALKHAEDLRREIAERIERLQRQRASAK